MERKILALLTQGDTGIDDLLGRLGEPPSQVLGSLVSLEMKHLVRQLPGKRVTRRVTAVAG
jgi:predicted Rossmann fold nucleotide-binding protein DprA/Smf involved in DNA uptake